MSDGSDSCFLLDKICDCAYKDGILIQSKWTRRIDERRQLVQGTHDHPLCSHCWQGPNCRKMLLNSSARGAAVSVECGTSFPGWVYRDMGVSGCNLEPWLPLGVFEVSIANGHARLSESTSRDVKAARLFPSAALFRGRWHLNKWMCHKSWAEKVWQMNRWLQYITLAARPPLADAVRRRRWREMICVGALDQIASSPERRDETHRCWERRSN